MTNLTEQYLNGNLQDGEEYYVENKDSEVSTMHLYNDTIHWHSFKVKKLKVLDKAPSFEEYQKLLSDQLAKNEGVEINAELEAENTKLKTENKWYSEQLNEAVKQYDNLKELLKECRRYIDYWGYDDTHCRPLLPQINQVLGDKTDEQKS